MRVSRVSRFELRRMNWMDQNREMGGISLCWIRSPRTRKKSRQRMPAGQVEEESMVTGFEKT